MLLYYATAFSRAKSISEHELENLTKKPSLLLSNERFFGKSCGSRGCHNFPVNLPCKLLIQCYKKGLKGPAFYQSVLQRTSLSAGNCSLPSIQRKPTRLICSVFIS